MLGFALGQAIGRHFDPVITAVAHQVGQRVGDLFDQALVQFGRFTQGHQFHLLAQLVRQIAQHAWEAAENDGHWNHADRHHRLLQVARVAIQIGQPGQQLLIDPSIEAPAVLRQHGLRDHQFTHQVDQLIDLLHIHADGGGLHLRLHRHLGLGARLGSSFGSLCDRRVSSRCSLGMGCAGRAIEESVRSFAPEGI